MNNYNNISYGKAMKKSMLLIITISILLLSSNITLGNTPPDYTKEEKPKDTEFDDCESTEVTVNGITSPPFLGKTGTYDVTGSFTAVGITVNGNNNHNENEPWIEHKESPDNNGTPQINFYISCDEEFMYIAFENNTGSIQKGKIFIDKNMNGTWDDTHNDTLFTINSSGPNSNKVKDHDGSIIPNSEVGWGDQGRLRMRNYRLAGRSARRLTNHGNLAS